MDLFPSEYQALGFSILNDDVLSFEKHYQPRAIIDNQPLLSFIAESKAYKILTKILLYYPKEFKQAKAHTKQILFKNIFAYIDNKVFIRFFIHCLITNYTLSKKDKQNLLLGMIRCLDKADIKQYLQHFSVLLTYQQVMDLLLYVKNLDVQNAIKLNTLYYLQKHIQTRKSDTIFIILTANMEFAQIDSHHEVCTEILLFTELPQELQWAWKNHIMTKRNIRYYVHKVFPYQLKASNEIDENDVNIDFLFFFVYYVLPVIQTLSKKEKTLLQTMLIKMRNDIFYVNILDEYIHQIEFHLLRNDLKNTLPLTTQKKGIRKI